LFDETMARLRFPIDGKELASAAALNLLSDRDPARRRMAAKSIGRVLGDVAPTFALLTNTLAKDLDIANKWRRYPRVDSSRNLGNFVEDEVVDALRQAVQSSYPRLSHRYYRLKARWLGGE